MAMPRLAFSALLLAGASAAGGPGHEGYVREYAGDYGSYARPGPQNGEFSDYVRRYAQEHSDSVQRLAGNFSKDRIAEAERYMDKYTEAERYTDKYTEGAGLAAAVLPGSTQLLSSPAAAARAEAPAAAGRNATSARLAEEVRVAEAQAALRSASAEAESSIAELAQFDARMRRNLKDEGFMDAAAEGIVARAQAGLAAQRQKVNRSFESALAALDPSAMATANSSEVDKAVDAAKAAIEHFRHLDEAESREARSTLRALERSSKDTARRLWKAAKAASSRVYRHGMAVAQAQRRAGLHERVYQRTESEAEESSERLRERAEEVAEGAEGVVERESGKVEHRLERAMDERRDAGARVGRDLRRRLRHAKDLVQQARRAAEERAAAEAKSTAEARAAAKADAAAKARAASEAKVSPAAGAHAAASRKVVAKEKAAPAEQAEGKEEGAEGAAGSPSSAFLARRAPRELGGGLVAPLACVAMTAAVAALLVGRRCGRPAFVEHPLLG